MHNDINQLNPTVNAARQNNVVCPIEFKPIVGYSMFGERELDGSTVRNYMGWCSSCNSGFEVCQFKAADGKWHLHAFRYYAKLVEDGKDVPICDWQLIEALPKVGGCECLNKKEMASTFEILRKLSISLTNLTDCLNSVLEAHGENE